jgi:predicted ATPase
VFPLVARTGVLAEVDAVLTDARAMLAGHAGHPASNPAGDLPDPEGARSQLSFDLAEVFAAVAAERPVLVIVDDAYHADTSSLRLLAELAPALRVMPAAVRVPPRDGDQDWQGKAAERGALLRSGPVITLPPFGPDDVASLVGSVTASPGGRPALAGHRSAG